MAKHAFNASKSTSSMLSFFFVNYGFESKINFELIKTKNTTRKKFLKQKAKNIKKIIKKFEQLRMNNFDKFKRIKKNTSIKIAKKRRIIA